MQKTQDVLDSTKGEVMDEVKQEFFDINTDIIKHGLKLIFDLEKEGDYDKRNELVFFCMNAARSVGIKSGIRIDPEEPEWPVVFIELPQGQVSWHVPQHDVPWDGHTTEQKYQRIKEFCEQ